MFLDGGSRVNIITDKLKLQLSLFKPNLEPYNLHMVDQTIAKPLGLIKNLKIFIHGIAYIVTYTVIDSNVLVSSHDFHFGISNEKEDVMFAIELDLFSIQTIGVLTQTELVSKLYHISNIGMVE